MKLSLREKNPAFGILNIEMTIDERLDRLTARHEALTETVEILVHRQTAFLDRQEAINEKNQVVMAEIMDSINSLARIAQLHERRISDLE